MKLSKYNAIRFVDIIKHSNKDILTCEDLASMTAMNLDDVVDIVEEFYSMIRIDVNYNLRNLLSDFEAYIEYLEKNNLLFLENEDEKPEDDYVDFIDYINKNMTIGGILNTKYILTEKDKRILKKLLYKSSKK